MASRRAATKDRTSTNGSFENGTNGPNVSHTAESMADRLSRVSQTSLANRSFTADPNTEPVGLKRQINLFSGVTLIVGTMIGSGIFISPSGVTAYSGSVGLSLILWAVGGIISFFGALSYAELGTIICKSGAEYVYLLESYSSLNKHVGQIIAFLYAWMTMTLLKPASVAIITLTFATYCLEPAYDHCPPPIVGIKLLAILCIIVITVINSVSLQAATWIQNIFTIAKLILIVIIVFGGFVLMGLDYTNYLSTGFEGTKTSAGSVAIAIYHSMWAYDGWNNLNYATDELINMKKNLPLAILIALPLVTICYILANVSYFTMMSVTELMNSPAVAITWGNRTLGVMHWIVPLFVACSTFGAANGTLFSTGRLNYAAAKEGHTVKLLSMVQVKSHMPVPALIFTAIIAIIFVCVGSIASLIEFFSFAVWLFYGLTMASLIIIRFKWKPEKNEDSFRIPIFIPIIVLIVAIFLVVAPIIDKPRLEFLYAFLFIIGGLIFYIPFVHFKKELPCMRRFTIFFAYLLNVELPIEDVL